MHVTKKRVGTREDKRSFLPLIKYVKIIFLDRWPELSKTFRQKQQWVIWIPSLSRWRKNCKSWKITRSLSVYKMIIWVSAETVILRIFLWALGNNVLISIGTMCYKKCVAVVVCCIIFWSSREALHREKDENNMMEKPSWKTAKQRPGDVTQSVSHAYN